MNELTLFTETAIDACHRLNDYDGNCKNWHGHTWLLQLWIKGAVKDRDAVGILFDFKKVKDIAEQFDHKVVNDIIPENPTAENIVLFIYKQLHDWYPNLKFKIRLYETAVLKKTYVEFGDFL